MSSRQLFADLDLVFSLTQPGSVSQRNLERQGFTVAYTRFTMVREVQK
jgi:hypothetical protein